MSHTTFNILPKTATDQEKLDWEKEIAIAVGILDPQGEPINKYTTKHSNYIVHPTQDIEDPNFGSCIYAINGIYHKYIGDPSTKIDDIETNDFRFDEADYLPSANFATATDDKQYSEIEILAKGFLIQITE